MLFQCYTDLEEKIYVFLSDYDPWTGTKLLISSPVMNCQLHSIQQMDTWLDVWGYVVTFHSESFLLYSTWKLHQHQFKESTIFSVRRYVSCIEITFNDYFFGVNPCLKEHSWFSSALIVCCFWTGDNRKAGNERELTPFSSFTLLYLCCAQSG